MDTTEDASITRTRAEIRRDRSLAPCDRYEAHSDQIEECSNCGWGHRVTYYEVGPALAARTGKRYVAVDAVTGKVEHVDRFPKGALVVEAHE